MRSTFPHLASKEDSTGFAGRGVYFRRVRAVYDLCTLIRGRS
ncbi:hypothetical protein BH10PSE10_BH10PSE10_02860 [soil metagenome]